MGSLAGKSPANTYKSLLKVADETNGVTTTPSIIEDGEGSATCLDVSANKFRVKPNSDNNEGFAVKKSAGNNIFTVDTSNDLVKVGTSQVSATTQLFQFDAFRLVPTSAGTHMFVPQGVSEFAGHYPEVANGTGTNPDTSVDKTSDTDYTTNFLFPAMFNMTIDAVKVLISTDTVTDTVCNVHLMSYDMVNDGTSNDGNLSNGTVLADGQATSVNRSVVKTIDCTIQSSSVTSNKVIACFVENETNTDDINIKVLVKYHIA